jgi:hypothetical protein
LANKARSRQVEAYADGLTRGREQGLTESARTVLLSLLTKRWAPLPETVRSQIVQADVTSLQPWFERSIFGADTDMIFMP